MRFVLILIAHKRRQLLAFRRYIINDLCDLIRGGGGIVVPAPL